MALPLDFNVSPTRAATCLIVCGCYCLAGGIFYSFLEPEWSFTDCIYFSFVASAEWKPCHILLQYPWVVKLNACCNDTAKANI